jgi:hypothetical protein
VGRVIVCSVILSHTVNCLIYKTLFDYLVLNSHLVIRDIYTFVLNRFCIYFVFMHVENVEEFHSYTLCFYAKSLLDKL